MSLQTKCVYSVGIVFVLQITTHKLIKATLGNQYRNILKKTFEKGVF